MGIKALKDSYPVVIVGAGIVGAGISRDLALHNVEHLIIDQSDFMSETSQSSSKMLHGGIRYLENYDFSLVREALHEKNLWLKLAPELVKEKKFYLPIYKDSKYPLWIMGLGLFVYDFLSAFKNRPHKMAGYKKTIKKLKGIKQDELRGSGIYYDSVVDDAKLGLECLFDAINTGNSTAQNYTKLTGVKYKKDIIEISIKNVITNETNTLTCKELVFATGPFTDEILHSLNIPWRNRLLLSRGSHLWLKPDALDCKHSIVLQTNDKRIIFVIPQERGILIGTTEVEIDSMLEKGITQDEIIYLLKCVNEYFPDSNVNEQDILSTFSGVRPLVRDECSHNPKQTSRVHHLYHPTPNTHVLLGGKYTTFRTMAHDVTSLICKRFSIKHDKRLTTKPLVKKCSYKSYSKFDLSPKYIEKVIKSELVCTFDDLLTRRMGLPTKSHWQEETSFEDFKQSAENLILESVRKS